MAIHWVHGGVERGTFRADDASYVTHFSAVVDLGTDIEDDSVVQMARAMELPVTVTANDDYVNVRIDFPDPSDDGMQHINPVANDFFIAMGWNPYY